MTTEMVLKTSYWIKVEADEYEGQSLIHQYDSIDEDTANDPRSLINRVRELASVHTKTTLDGLEITRHKVFSIHKDTTEGEVVSGSVKEYSLMVWKPRSRSKTQEVSLHDYGTGKEILCFTEVIGQKEAV